MTRSGVGRRPRRAGHRAARRGSAGSSRRSRPPIRSGSCRSGRSRARSESGARSSCRRSFNDAVTSGSLAGRTPRRTSSRKPASINDRWSTVMLPLPRPYVIAGVRIAGLGDADEVAGAVRAGAGGRHRPRLDVAREVVGGRLVEPGVGRVVVDRRDLRRGGQAGDLGRDRRRRVAALLLPALDAVRRTVGDEEVGGGNHVVEVERPGRPRARTASPSGSGTRSRRAGGRRCRAPACRSPASCAASSRRAAAGGRTGTASPRVRSGRRRRRADR